MLGPGQPFFPYWRAQLKICNFFFAFPYEWDKKGEKLRFLHNPRIKRLNSIGVWIPVVYFVVMALHLGKNGGGMTMSSICTGFVNLFMFGLGSVLRLTFWFWEKDGLKMFNGILDFEKKIYKGIGLGKCQFVMS
jgi:hypothetical protein